MKQTRFIFEVIEMILFHFLNSGPFFQEGGGKGEQNSTLLNQNLNELLNREEMM